MSARGAPRPGAAPAFRPDELYRVPTADGAAVALGRYRPRGERRFLEPVVLCHGLAANRFMLDLDERTSLARHLARAGFEAWVLELRGRGLSGPCGEASFDDQAVHDVGAALRCVRSAQAPLPSGAPPRALWVGHSKGGLLAYAHLARSPDAPLAAVATLGSPLSFAAQPGLRELARRLGPVLARTSLPTRHFGAVAVLGLPPGALGRSMARVENLEPDVLRRALAACASDIPGGVARQLAQWMATGRFTSLDGAHDYAAGLAHVRTPVLALAGALDLMAPPTAVAEARALLGGPVEVVVAGRAHGFREDYGHADLVLGRHAPAEVFPVVERFLARHATAAAA